MSVQRQIDRLIAYQAAEWFEALKNGDEAHRAGFTHWVSQSPRNMEAFLAIASEAPVARKVLASGQFDVASLLRQLSETDKTLLSPFLVNPRPLHPKPDAAEPATIQRSRPMRRWKALAAAVVAIAAVGGTFEFKRADWQHFETSIGEQRVIQLNDGSVVNLDAQSQVAVRFSKSQREVHLVRGEATFKVAHDTSRPFRVHTADAIVEAVGTQFNVYARRDGTTSVYVLEGKVEVIHTGLGPAMPASAPVPLAAGEEAQVRSSGAIERGRNPDMAEAIAWQQRKLIFKRTSLDDMAAEFNRYNRAMQIHLEGIGPGEFRFTGAFDADDPRSLAVLLSKEPDLAVERRDGEIVIRKR
jgi:transmembrane sensor